MLIKLMGKQIGNLKGSKIFKVFALVANVLFGAWIMGVVQPKLNILMRKILNNGDNTNPAIAFEEEKMRQKIKTHQG